MKWPQTKDTFIFLTDIVSKNNLQSGQSVTLHQPDKTSGSDERDADVSAAAGDTSQTRSDKWKAKHEAMLKLAVSPPKHRLTADNISSENNSADTEHSRLLKNNISTHESTEEEYAGNKSSRRHSDKLRSESVGAAEQIKKSENVKDVTRMSTSTRSMKPVLAL